MLSICGLPPGVWDVHPHTGLAFMDSVFFLFLKPIFEAAGGQGTLCRLKTSCAEHARLRLKSPVDVSHNLRSVLTR